MAIGTDQGHRVQSRRVVYQFGKVPLDEIDNSVKQEDGDSDKDEGTPHWVREWGKKYLGINSNCIGINTIDESGVENPTLMDNIKLIKAIDAVENSRSSYISFISRQDAQ